MNSSRKLVAGALAALVLVPACGGGDPVDVSGNYSVSELSGTRPPTE